MKRCRILVIDDSPTARAALRAALGEDHALDVVGEAANGAEAREMIERLSPDLITMDVFLRAENGLGLTAAIMKERPTPIVVVTAADARDASLVFRALQAGALDVCAKLPSPTHPEYAARRTRLIRTLKTLQQVPLVHRRRTLQPRVAPPAAVRSTAGVSRRSLLLLGASTGGPPVLAKLLRSLPKPCPVPIALVQHMIGSFVPGFAKWLADDTGHAVSLLEASCSPKPSVIYMAGGDRHLVVEPGGMLGVSDAAPRSFHRPSIDVLFEAAARSPAAAQSIAALFTGMGGDGARGLLALRRAGAHTIAQDPSSCTVASMPERAIALDAADEVLLPDAMPAALSLVLRA